MSCLMGGTQKELGKHDVVVVQGRAIVLDGGTIKKKIFYSKLEIGL